MFDGEASVFSMVLELTLTLLIPAAKGPAIPGMSEESVPGCRLAKFGSQLISLPRVKRRCICS